MTKEPTLSNEQKELIKKTFKLLLEDEDKMKYLAYSTQMFPVVERLLKKERAEALAEVKTKCYSEWRENGTMTWEVFEGIIEELEGKSLVESKE